RRHTSFSRDWSSDVCSSDLLELIVKMLTMSSVVSAPRPVHVMTKPIGPICNLDCKYCFYLEKEKLYPDQRRWKMSDELLESYIRSEERRVGKGTRFV